MPNVPLLMAVVDMSPEELAIALINKEMQSIPTEVLKILIGRGEEELVNRLAAECGYTQTEG